MSQDPSIHPLDLDPQDDGRDLRVQTYAPQGIYRVFAAFGSLFALMTLLGAALMNLHPSTTWPTSGRLLWEVGGYGLIVCCFLTLFTIRRNQIYRLFQRSLHRAMDWSHPLESQWWTLVMLSIGGFLIVAVVLALLHLTLGSIKSANLYFSSLPILTALVLAFIGTTHREYRAFWIGLATAMVMGGLVDDFGRYFQNMPWAGADVSASSGVPPRTRIVPGGSSAMVGRLKGIKPMSTGYRFEYRLLLVQIATVGWAVFTGLLCSLVVALSGSFSAKARKESGIIKEDSA